MGINLRKVPMDNKLQRMVTIPQYVSSPASYQPNKTVIDNGRNMMLPLITQAAYEKGNVGIYIDKCTVKIEVQIMLILSIISFKM